MPPLNTALHRLILNGVKHVSGLQQLFINTPLSSGDVTRDAFL